MTRTQRDNRESLARRQGGDTVDLHLWVSLMEGGWNGEVRPGMEETLLRPRGQVLPSLSWRAPRHVYLHLVFFFYISLSTAQASLVTIGLS